MIERKRGKYVICIYSFLLFIFHLIRCFDNNFWGDETYSIRLAKMTVPGLISETASDVHPPLYYIILKLFSSLLGFRGSVFHVVSLLAYAAVIIIAVTVIFDRIGRFAAFFLVTCASFVPNAVHFNVEVRMYSFGALFVLLSFLFLRNILCKDEPRDYVFFVVFSLAAAYTHYYCLISVAFFYVVLLILALLYPKKILKKVLLACIATVVLYLPWFVVLLNTFRRTTDEFWMAWTPYLSDCLSFFYSGRFGLLLFFVFIVISVCYILHDALNQKKDRDNTDTGDLTVKLFRLEISGDGIWFMAGLFSILGTVAVGMLVSKFIRPVLIVRYLYPVSVITWLLAGVGISCFKSKFRTVLSVVLSALLLCSSLPESYELIKSDTENNELFMKTVSQVNGRIGADDIILTDLQVIDWSVGDYYFPEAEIVMVSPDAFPLLESGKEYWLIINPDYASDYEKVINSDGSSCEQIVHRGSIGTVGADIYLLMQDR